MDKIVTPKSNVVVPTTPAEIPLPAEYVALGLTTGYNPCTIEEVRLYITGLPGEGKSTLVASIPDSMTIDYERGATGIPGRRSAYFNIFEAAKKQKKTAYEIHRTILDKLMEDAKSGKPPCKRIIFDTHDGWVELETINFLKEKSSGAKVYEDIGQYGEKGAGHSLVQGRCRRILSALESVGYAWAVVGHLTYVPETTPDGKTQINIRPILSKGYVGSIVRKAELHLTINSMARKERVNQVVKGHIIKGAKEEVVTRYFLYTKPTEAKRMEGKQRGVPNLARVLEVPMIGGWEILKKAYDEAVKKSKIENSSFLTKLTKEKTE